MAALRTDIIAEIIRCCDFAAKKHTNQRRKDEEETPHINHPLGEIKLKSYDNNRWKYTNDRTAKFELKRHPNSK